MNTLNDIGLSLAWGQNKKYYFILAYALLVVDALGGVLRYYSSMYHAELLVYVPKLIALFVVVVNMLRFRIPLDSKKDIPAVLVAHGVLLFSIWVAIFNQLSLASIGYMLMILAPFLYGMHLSIPNKPEIRSVVAAVAVLWFVTSLGIVMECFVPYPWKNAEMEVYGKVVEVNRSWTTTGIEWDRLAGFTRLSNAAAFYCGILGIVMLRMSKKKYIQALIVLVTFSALILTTTKSAILAFVLALFLYTLKSWPWFRAMLYAAMLLLAVYLPLSSSLAGGLAFYQNQNDALSELLLFSFNDRLMNTWPQFLSAIDHMVIGQGLGGVGTPNQMYGYSTANPSLDYADSFPLYLIGVFGLVPGTMIFAALGYSSYRMAFNGNLWQQALGLAGIFILMAGISLDVIESVAAGLLLGMIVRGMDELAHPVAASLPWCSEGGFAGSLFSSNGQPGRSR